MITSKAVSIIISSYNYERFLSEAIDSALSQTYSNTEVIVVDDGSTDNSRLIIAGYGQRVLSILKKNEGQASAFNAGFRASHGDLICFMDSADLLLPTAMEKAVERFCEGNAVKVHWPLWIIDENGKKTGDAMHKNDLPEGDLRDVLLRKGPGGYSWPSTTGNAWARGFIERIFPMPEAEYKIGPDIYLSALAPLFGPIKRVVEPQGCYRIHGENNTYRQPFGERVKYAVRFWNHCFGALHEWCQKMGIEVEPELWKEHSWWHQTELAIQEILAVIPQHKAFILVDEDQWVTDNIEDRHCIPFIERDGHYWGRPEDDKTAIAELERLRSSDADFLVFPWWTFWWREHYPEFYRYLSSNYRCVMRTDRLVIFEIGDSSPRIISDRSAEHNKKPVTAG